MPNGLVQGHAYTVTGVKEVKNYTVITVIIGSESTVITFPTVCSLGRITAKTGSWHIGQIC